MRETILVLPARAALLVALPFMALCPAAPARPEPAAGKVPDALVEAWRGLEKLDDSVKSYSVKRKLEIFEKAGPRVHTSAFRVSRGPGHRLQTGTAQDREGAHVVAVSPAYRFILSGGDGGKWSLRGIETGQAKDGSDGGKEYPIFPLSASAERVTFADDAVSGRIRPTATTRLDDGRTKIEFDYIPDPKYNIVGRGTLVFEERAGGIVHDYRATWKLLDGENVSRTVTRTFYPLAPGRTVPEVRTLREVEGWENDRSESTYEFSDYDYGPLREEEFRLSNYGLPEPEGVGPVRPSVPYYLWLIGGAVVLALGALVYRRPARRAEKPST